MRDSWTAENDLLLAEIILRHIREGSTQLSAFEEVAKKLNQTSASCGFRWNAVVRHQYKNAIELAKRQRKTKLNQSNLVTVSQVTKRRNSDSDTNHYQIHIDFSKLLENEGIDASKIFGVGGVYIKNGVSYIQFDANSID